MTDDTFPPSEDADEPAYRAVRPEIVRQDRALCLSLGTPQRMRQFCRVNLPKGRETTQGRFDVSEYLTEGYYVRLTPGLGQIGDVVNGLDGHEVEGNVMTMLRVISQDDPQVLPPPRALERFMKLLEEPAEWAGGQEADESEGIWVEEVEVSLVDNYIIEGWLYRDSITVYYGQRASYKSFGALGMALSAAYGLPDWFGRKILPAGAIYVAAEGGEGIMKRIRAFQIYHGIDPKTVAPFKVIPAQLNLGDPLTVARLIGTIKRSQAERTQTERDVWLLVLDTLARSMRGLNENAAVDVSYFLDQIEKIKKATGVAILLVAHAGKDPDAGARGSSMIEADVDAVIRVLRSKEDNTATATVTKLKDDKDGDTLTFTLHAVEVGTSPLGNLKTSGVLVEAIATEKPAEILLEPIARDALEALRTCIITTESKLKKPPEGVPGNVKVTTLKLWRAEFAKKRGFEDWGSTQYRQFDKARDALLDARLVAIQAEWVWLYRAAEAAPMDETIDFGADPLET